MKSERERWTRPGPSIDFETDPLQSLRAHAELRELAPVEAGEATDPA